MIYKENKAKRASLLERMQKLNANFLDMSFDQSFKLDKEEVYNEL